MSQCPNPGEFFGLTRLLVSLAFCAGLVIPAMDVRSAESAAQAASAFHESALQKLAEGDVRAAIIELKNAVQSDPTYLPARLLLAQAYIREGAGAEAELELENAEMLGADPVLLIVPMAKALLLQQKFDVVLEAFDPSKYDPGIRQQLLVARGEAFLEISQFKSAREEYQAAVEMDAAAVAPYVGLARVALQENDLSGAATYASRAVEKGPRNIEAWQTKASIEHAQGQLSEAEQSYARVLELDPGHIEARVGRSGVLVDLGDDVRAMAAVEALRADQPLDPRATYLQAILLTRAGDSEAAREALERTAGNLKEAGEQAINRSGQLLLIASSTFFDLGELDIAVDYLKRYLFKEPRNTEMRKVLGKIRLEHAKHNLAIEALEPGLKMSPNDPELLLLLASAYSAAERHIDATPLLEKALDLTDGSVLVRTTLAKNRLLRGQAAAAMRELEISYAGDPSRQQAGLLLVISHTQRRDYERALAIATSMAEHAPDNVTLQNLLGRTQAAAGLTEKARNTFERVLTIDDGFLSALHSLADLSVLGGDTTSARKWLTRALEKIPEDKATMIKLSSIEEREDDVGAAVRWLQKAQGKDPEGIRATLELVRLYLRTNDTEAAIRAAEEAERAHPDDLNVLAAVGRSHLAAGENDLAGVLFVRMAKLAGYQADALLEIADYQLQAGKSEDAVWTLHKARQNSPDSVAVMDALVRAQVSAGLFAEAERVALQVLETKPQDATGHRLLGEVYFYRGDLSLAIESFSAALAISADPYTAVRLSQTLQSSGDNTQALVVLEDAWMQTPLSALLRAALAEAYLRGGQLEQSKLHFLAVIDDNPNDAYALNNLANILYWLSDPSALTFAERAAVLAPRNPAVSDTFGWLLVEDGQAVRGLPYLRDAHTRASSNPEIGYHVAVALMQLGRLSEAKIELEKSLATGITFEGIERAQRLLETLQ